MTTFIVLALFILALIVAPYAFGVKELKILFRIVLIAIPVIIAQLVKASLPSHFSFYMFKLTYPVTALLDGQDFWAKAINKVDYSAFIKMFRPINAMEMQDAALNVYLVAFYAMLMALIFLSLIGKIIISKTSMSKRGSDYLYSDIEYLVTPIDSDSEIVKTPPLGPYEPFNASDASAKSANAQTKTPKKTAQSTPVTKNTTISITSKPNSSTYGKVSSWTAEQPKKATTSLSHTPEKHKAQPTAITKPRSNAQQPVSPAKESAPLPPISDIFDTVPEVPSKTPKVINQTESKNTNEIISKELASKLMSRSSDMSYSEAQLHNIEYLHTFRSILATIYNSFKTDHPLTDKDTFKKLRNALNRVINKANGDDAEKYVQDYAEQIKLSGFWRDYIRDAYFEDKWTTEPGKDTRTHETDLLLFATDRVLEIQVKTTVQKATSAKLVKTDKTQHAFANGKDYYVNKKYFNLKHDSSSVSLESLPDHADYVRRMSKMNGRDVKMDVLIVFVPGEKRSTAPFDNRIDVRSFKDNVNITDSANLTLSDETDASTYTLTDVVHLADYVNAWWSKFGGTEVRTGENPLRQLFLEKRVVDAKKRPFILDASALDEINSLIP